MLLRLIAKRQLFCVGPTNGKPLLSPRRLTSLTGSGVPYIAVIVVMILSCLSFLALGSSSAQVLNWILK
jgi:amino acid permease